MRRFVFPYGNLTLLSLMLTVVLSGAFSYYVYQTVLRLTGGDLHQPGVYWKVLVVLGMPAALALYVVGAIVYRRRMILDVGPETLTLSRWLRSALEIDIEAITSITVRQTSALTWQMRVEHRSGTVKLPLSDAVVHPDGERHRIRTETSVRNHPLLIALSKCVGDERISVVAR